MGDGPSGPGTNKGCIEVQIALLTERVRNMILHIRDFKHDYKCRMKLVSLVARRDRKQAPGRKVAMRLKKTGRLLQRRLAAQLKQGKPRMVIHKTEKKIKSRRWFTRAYDEVESLISNRTPTEYIDPLNMP